MRFKKLLVPFFVLLATAVAIGARFTESPKNAMAQAGSVEQDKQRRIRNTLSDLLGPLGVEVPQILPFSDAQEYKQLSVRWQSSDASGGKLEKQQPHGLVTLVDSKKRSGSLPRERSLELSTNQILIIALDQKGRLLWWRLMLDPRLVRSETPGPGGVISGEDYYLTKTDFMIEYPDDAGIKELRLYHPQWTGSAFSLDLLSILPLS